jgi:hypothetical protein
VQTIFMIRIMLQVYPSWSARSWVSSCAFCACVCVTARSRKAPSITSITDHLHLSTVSLAATNIDPIFSSFKSHQPNKASTNKKTAIYMIRF